jgi:lipid II:glycine glycyltransferase (peptidoglycan interpeptide bridge formation enzyme)
MELIELGEKNIQEYQRLVDANGSFLQNWAWGDFQKSVGKDVKRFAITEGEKFVFAAQGIYTKQGSKAYLFLPYGPVLEDSIRFEDLFNFFAQELKQKYQELLFVRFEYCPALEFSKNFNVTKSPDLNPHRTLILDITKSEEDLLKEMHHKTRYNIKVSKKHNVEVRVTNDLGSAGDLFLETAERQGVKAFEKDYYKKMLEFFAEEKYGVQAKLYTAWHEGDLLAANLMIYSKAGKIKNLMIYLFGASSDHKRNVMGPYALHWQAILDAKAAGFTSYDFWGYESDPNHPWHGFSKFKAGFSGKESMTNGTYDFPFNAAWYNAYKILRALNRKIRK